MSSQRKLRVLSSALRPLCSVHAPVSRVASINTAFRPQSYRPATLRAPFRVPLAQRRWHSTPASKSQVYNFDQIQDLSSSPSPSRILIDVREPSEYASGYIPTALNVPINSNPDALFLPPDEFEDRFGFPKPETDKEVVFYCKAGVRSSAAAKLAEQSGYEKIAEYRGSWLEWERKGGEKAMP